MRFEFIADEHVKVKTFLKSTRFSKGLLPRLSFEVELFWSIINRKMQRIYWTLETTLPFTFPLRKALKPWRLLSIH